MIVKTYNLLVKLVDQAKEDAVRKALCEVQKDLISMAGEIDTLRKVNLEMENRKKELEAKLLEYENWSKVEENYCLTELATGVFVYTLKPDAEISEPRHHLCTKCFQEKRKSPLNRSRRDPGGTYYTCPNCKTDFIDHTDRDGVGAVCAARPSRTSGLLDGY